MPVLLPFPIQGGVVFDHVSFHYNGSSDTTVLEDISFTAEPHQIVAILGATGSGKTSLVNLVPRFYDPTAGRILIDGMDVKEFQQDSLRAQVAVVPQETVLFSGTIRDNIRYGNPQAGEQQVLAAARAACVDEFISQPAKRLSIPISRNAASTCREGKSSVSPSPGHF